MKMKITYRWRSIHPGALNNFDAQEAVTRLFTLKDFIGMIDDLNQHTQIVYWIVKVEKNV